MKILTPWLRSFLPPLPVDDAQLAEDLTLRGIAVEGVFELNDLAGDSNGSLFDTDITTNRVDAMNHYGIAREAAAIYNLPLHPLETTLPARTPAPPFPVRIEAPDLCGRFTAQVLRDVTVAPTQGKLAHYFAELGQKSISNAVDITNFVLLGMGQPTHAFDLDKIEGGLVVRRARPGEQLHLLDGTTRTLVPQDLVVADERKPLALAGVMGGWDSMITPETRNILVEAAWFSPAAIRASSRRHGLHTDASHRFERGADFAAAPIANALVCREILAACGGRLEGDFIDLIQPAAAAETTDRSSIQLSVARTQKLLGATLSPQGITSALIAQYLTALGCTLAPVSDKDNELYNVRLPSWRLDLSREIDLIEEVARVYGYNRFADTLPKPGVQIAHRAARPEAAVRARLLALGFSEALSSTFASASESALFAPAVVAVALENPLNEEAANLRPSLLPGMLGMLAANLTRDVLDVRLFETGALFTGSPAAVEEHQSLVLGLTGAAAPSPLASPANAPFFELKGALESLFHLFSLPPLACTPASSPFLETGRAASFTLAGRPLAGRPLATFGQLAAAEAARRKLRQPVFLAELDLAALLAHPLRTAIAQDLSRFQAVDRDFSFTFPEGMVWSTLEHAIQALGIAELTTLRPLEIFRDPQKLPGHFNILLRATFQSPTRTLTETDLTAWWAAIITTLQSLGGTLRDH